MADAVSQVTDHRGSINARVFARAAAAHTCDKRCRRPPLIHRRGPPPPAGVGPPSAGGLRCAWDAVDVDLPDQPGADLLRLGEQPSGHRRGELDTLAWQRINARVHLHAQRAAGKRLSLAPLTERSTLRPLQIAVRVDTKNPAARERDRASCRYGWIDQVQSLSSPPPRSPPKSPDGSLKLAS